ncbi:MAG: hypothetical protein ACE5E7_11905 [Anaerolineae bacterium]
MSFRCPSCETADSLKIVSALELPPDVRSDEITLQIVRCTGCGFRGAAVYEESRRGSLDSESWHHDGYYVDESDLNLLISIMGHCPTPDNDECRCPAHRLLGQTNDQSVWYFPGWIKTQGMFALIRR